jgi:hypothetical protein
MNKKGELIEISSENKANLVPTLNQQEMVNGILRDKNKDELMLEKSGDRYEDWIEGYKKI